MTPAPARARNRAQTRTTVAPRGPRRVSGPVARRAVALPAGTATAPRRTGTTGLFARVRALPEHRVIDRLLRSRLWIWALGALLGGIVAMQVSLLKLNSGISRAVETTTTLERQNAGLEASIARLSSPDRIETGAGTLGMVMPPAGDVGYLRSGPEDASAAARKMKPPSADAAALLANGGIVPGSLADTTVAQVDTTVAQADTTVAPADTATAPVEPVATPDPAVAATPEPVVTPDPAAATTTTTTTVAPAAGQP